MYGVKCKSCVGNRMGIETWRIKGLNMENLRKNMPICEFVYKRVSAA